MPTPIQFESAQPCEGVLNDFFTDQPADRCIDCTRHAPDPRARPRGTVYLDPKFGRREGFLVCLDRRSDGTNRPAAVFASNQEGVGAVADHAATLPKDGAARESAVCGGVQASSSAVEASA